MQRLADYFAVVGYDHDEERGGRSFGKIIQRFPEKDWPNCPFNCNVVHFCQPQGWMLTPKWEFPTFFISILTDLDGQRHYCACLTFHETLLQTTIPTSSSLSTKPRLLSDFTLSSAADEADDTAFLIPRTQMFAPKCLVLTSRFDCFEIFRNCLGLLYTVYVESLSDIRIENLVGNIIGSVNVPPAGGQALRFSIGADDRQILQPPLSSTVPCTGLSVYNLFKELGIDHVVTIFCAVLSDIKILFFSKSYSKLTDSCKAIETLLYPLKYCYTFIPVLPFDLLEILDAPTSYIVGVHSDQKLQALSNFDGMWIDLDGSSVHFTDGVKLAPMPEKVYCRVLASLFQVLKPDIHMADLAFPIRTNIKQDGQIADYPKYKDEINKDKQIRSIFIRLFAELLAGYRSCLLIIRINPKPVISFHKASFLGHHRLVNDEFMQRVLDSMAFHKFIEERGPPYRSCDIFDEVYGSIHEQLKHETDSMANAQEHIRELANQLLLNENPSLQQTYTQKVLQPSTASYNRTNLSEFPHLEKDIVHNVIKEGLKRQQNSRPFSARISEPCLVKIGTPINVLNGRTDLSQSARRLEVLKQCIGYIFNDKIADAKKTSGAVFYSLKSHEDARVALCMELSLYKNQNKPRLNNQQFEMIVNLLNCALEAGSSIDEHGIAYKMLILATTFHRKLSEEATQFVYTDIQRHPVWNNMQFWEMSFYSDVQLQIRNLYLSSDEYMSHSLNNSNNNDSSFSLSTDTGTHHIPTMVNESFDYSSHNGTILTTVKNDENDIKFVYKKTALGIAAEQMRLYTQKTVDEQRTIQELEEQTLYALAIHYIQLMVYMKLPLDISSSHIRHSTLGNNHNSHTGCDRDSINSDLFHSNDRYSVRNPDETSTIGSRDSGNEFDMNDDETTDLVLNFVKKFIDKICDEGGVTQAHQNSLHTKLFQTVQVQIEVLEKVYKETRRVAPIPKPILPRFIMIPENTEHEEYYALRSYLLPDGRDEFFSQNSVTSLLPAEGALIMTNYRLIFRGRPVNPAISNEYLIVRSFPISALIREKKLSGQFRVDNSNICLHNGMQLRSATFQLIKVYFDDEVSLEDIDKFRNKLVEKRYPQSIFQSFSFSIYSEFSPVMNKQKDGTLKKYSRYARNVLRKKGLIPAKDLSVHLSRNNFIGNSASMGHHIGNNKTILTSTNSTKYSQVVMIRTPEPPRRILTLSNTRSSKFLTSATLMQTSSNIATTTIHECDEMIKNNSDDEDEDSLSAIDEADSTNFSDTKSLERYTDSAVYKDFVRQGLIANVTTFGLRSTMRVPAVSSFASIVSLPVLTATSLSSNENNSNGQQQSTLPLLNTNTTSSVQTNGNSNNILTNTTSLANDDCFRVSHINRNFTFCQSYPPVLVLPKDILDENLKKVARCHKLQRVPVIVWRNPRTKALLLRGSGFYNKGFISLLVKGPQTTNSSSSDTNASIEQERYFDAIVKLTPNKMPFSDIDNDELEITPDITPLSVRKNHHHHATTTRLQNFLPTRVRYDRPRTKNPLLRSSYIEPSTTSTGHGSVRLHKNRFSAMFHGNSTSTVAIDEVQSSKVNISSHSTTDTLSISETTSHQGSVNSPSGVNNSTLDMDFNESILQVHKRSPLYIIGDRAQYRTGRLEQFHNYCFLPLEFHDISQIKTSFKNLLKACVPSNMIQSSNNNSNNNNLDTSTTITTVTFYKLIEESRWLHQLQKILMISQYIVQFSEDHASSVMICIEDGWDVSSQLVSISEILLDPYYRTFDGFQTLIEREWFAFGHRFSHRSNQIAANKTGFAAVFLQFLDLVHQIWNQYPTEFEFNDYYLRFIAYHHLSNRFKNFMFNCDSERKTNPSWYVDMKDFSKEHDDFGLYRCNTINIWDYITKVNRQSSRFYNFLYSPSCFTPHSLTDDNTVLRPSYKMYSLDVWDFYLSETLETGCTYDLDLSLAEHDERFNDTELKQRTFVAAFYDDVNVCLPDFFTDIVLETSNILQHTSDNWKHHWDKIEKPERERAQCLSMQDESQKKKFLQKNQQQNKSLSPSTTSRTSLIHGNHNYELIQFQTPHICDGCHKLIENNNNKKLHNEGIRGLQCRECLSYYHEHCRALAACRPCQQRNESQIVANSSRLETGSVTDITDVLLEKAGVYDHRPSSSFGVSNGAGPQHRTYEGYLRKRGHLLKQWKERWFVLDSVRHELRYYDSSDDQTPKGTILLADAVEVVPYNGPLPNALRRFDNRAAFELHTNRRVYNFIAQTTQEARTWTEKIKTCLLDS